MYGKYDKHRQSVKRSAQIFNSPIIKATVQQAEKFLSTVAHSAEKPQDVHSFAFILQMKSECLEEFLTAYYLTNLNWSNTCSALCVGRIKIHALLFKS